MNFKCIQTGLYELALHHQVCELSSSYRLSLLSTCLVNTKSLLALFSQPTSLTRSAPLATWVHYSFAILMAYKLSQLMVEGWDPLLAREEMNFNNTLETQIAKIDSLVAPTLNSADSDIFARFARQLKRIKSQLSDQTNANFVRPVSIILFNVLELSNRI